MSKSKLRWIGLQFFAEQPDDGGAGNEPESAGGTIDTDPPGGTEQLKNDPPPKTFTQEEVNRLLANEKRQGRQAALKALGLDPSDKNAEKNAKAILDAQKTENERNAEAIQAEKDARTEAEKKAEAAERKLLVLNSGCKKEYLDEVTALAAVKVSDDTDFEMALKSVKEKCASFFEDDNDTGTGSGQGHARHDKNNKPGSLGARLAQNIVSANTKENPYFKH